MSTKNQNHILITTSSFAQYDRTPLDTLEKAGYAYSLNPYGRKLEGQEVLDLAGDSVGVIAGTEKWDANILNQTSGIKSIARCGIGLDNIDLQTAKDLSIKVTNTTGNIAAAVAELAMGLILSLLRKIYIMNGQLKNAQWAKKMGNLLLGKKVGIVGFGRIGQKLASFLQAFDVQVGYFDLVQTDNRLEQYFPFNDLLAWSDIISIHVSGGDSCLFNAKEIQAMKDGSWLVNCSRGGVVDEEALYEALRTEKLSGAAVDVFAQEPYQGPLKDLDNIILTPHIGSYAKEARIEIEMEAVNNLLKSLGEEL